MKVLCGVMLKVTIHVVNKLGQWDYRVFEP